ncbi:MAG: quinol dehydrogenase ferredoxin subunit NapH [Thermodesulfovibrionales bacterium]
MGFALAGHRYLVSRRVSQAAILSLFIAGNLFGLKALRGNLSTSRALDSVYLADPFSVLQIAASGTVVAGEALFGAAVVLAFFGLVGGRTFCGWVCPMNAVTDCANWLGHKLGGVSGGRDLRISRDARYWAIGVSLVLSMLLGYAAFEQISPISMLHRGAIHGMGMGWAVVAAVFCFDLFVLRNGFCGHLCPLGGFYALAGRYGLLRVRHEKDKCTLCMKCIEHCPERQVLLMVGRQSGEVLSGECTNCGKCIDVCNDRAMGFGLRFSGPGARTDTHS